MYRPDKDDVFKIRQAIQRDQVRFRKLINAKKFKDLFGTIRGEANKRLPKEFQDAAERVPLIANKQFYYWAEYKDPKLVLREDLVDFVMEHFRTGRPINQFLREAVDA